MHSYTVKNWLWVGIVLLGLVISSSANAGQVCNFKEQTLLTNTEGDQVVSKHRVDTCIEKSSPVDYGMSAKCGVPREIDPRAPTNSISCQLDDGSWRQHNVFYAIDQYGSKKEISQINEPDFTDYRSGLLGRMFFAKLGGWSRGLNTDQKYLYLTSLTNALQQSSNGQGYQWKSGSAAGTVTVVATFQSSQGYCKILHTLVQSGDYQVADAHRACYNNTLDNWYWVADKY
jgi:surface antigen